MPDFDVHFEEFLHLAGLGTRQGADRLGRLLLPARRLPVRRVADRRRRGVRGGRADAALGDDRRRLGAVRRRDGRGRARRPRGRARGRRRAQPRVGRRARAGYRVRYRVLVDGRPWGGGELHDWNVERRRWSRRAAATTTASTRSRRPAPPRPSLRGARRLRRRDRRRPARRRPPADDRAALERAVGEHGVRLVITTGDNIYLGHQDTAGTGNEDDEWYSSFYRRTAT